jgi:hypothetical protein
MATTPALTECLPPVPLPQQSGVSCLVCRAEEHCARGLCRRCYDAAYHDDAHFAGARARVLARDGHRCQACGLPSRVVHHRRPGVHLDQWLITLCPACHATVEHLQWLDRYLPPFLQLLWEEQHPGVRPQQLALDLPGIFAFQNAASSAASGGAGKP